MVKCELPSLRKIARVLRYDPRTGVARWRVARKGGYKAGAVAGCLCCGYRVIQIDGHRFKASRIIWLLMTGEWPPKGMQIDHKNRDKADDRWDNLRLATHAENQQNRGMHRSNTTGLKGIAFGGRASKYQARIVVGNESRSLGYFTHAEEAHAAYREGARRLHGEFANLGMSDAEWDRRWRWFMCSRVWIDP